MGASSVFDGTARSRGPGAAAVRSATTRARSVWTLAVWTTAVWTSAVGRVAAARAAAAASTARDRELRGLELDRSAEVLVVWGKLLDGDRQPVAAFAHFDLGEQDVALHQAVLLLLVAVGPDGQLGGAAEVLDGDGGEGLALPGGEPSHAGDHAGHDGFLARQVGGQLGHLVRDPLRQALRRLAEGVRRDVRAEELTLPLADLTLRRPDRFEFERRQWRVHLGPEQVEHRGLARLALAQRLLRDGEDAVHAEHHGRAVLAAVTPQQRVERARLGERLQHAAVAVARVDATREVLDRGERSVLIAHREQALDGALPDGLDLREPEADRAGAVLRGMGGDAEVLPGVVDVRREHLDTEAGALGDRGRDAVLRARRVGAGGHQHRRHELDGVMGLEPRRAVRDHRVRERVRLVERVAREGLDEVEELFGEALLVALLDRAADEALALGEHHRGDLLAHRLPHHVGLPERVAGEDARDLQHLVLVRDHAVRLVEHRREVLVRVVGLGAPVLHVDVAGDVLHRARAVERDHCGELADIAGL